MNSIDLIKAAAVDSTNKLMYEHGLPPAMPACNTEAIEAYKLNVDADANAWKLLEEIGRKAALVDELFTQLKLTHDALIKYSGGRLELSILHKNNVLVIQKYEALPK